MTDNHVRQNPRVTEGFVARKEIARKLQEYNDWRRYNGDILKSPPQPNPTELGLIIDEAIRILNNG